MGARSTLAVLTCCALLSACAVGKNTKPSGAAGDGTATTTTSTTVASGVPATAPGATTSTATGAPASVGDVVGARTAMDSYLDAMVANDFPKALGASRDALASLAVVRSIVAASNAERGGKTTSTFGPRSFDVASATADEVRFTGRATLTSVVSGPAGPPVSTTDTFADVVVRRSPDGWRAASATYNNASLVASPASTSTTVGPVRIKLTGALAFGTSLAVVLQLESAGDHSVAVGDNALRINDEEAHSKAKVIVGGTPGYLYLTYPRRDQRPTQWRATLTIDGAAHPVTLPFG